MTLPTPVQQPEVHVAAEEAVVPAAAPAAPAERACDTCGNAMAPGQGWCLECGTAAPGRLGGRPGWRAAVTVVAAVLVLVGGAVAASYAALSGDAQRQAAAPPPPDASPQIAAVPAPAAAAAPPAAAPVAPAAAPAPAPAAKPAATPKKKATKKAPATKQKAATPAQSEPEVKPRPVAPSVKAGLQSVELGPDAAAVYDPYTTATDQTDPADAYDGDRQTAFTVTTDPTEEMAVGLDFDLESARGVRALELRTTTPGFTVEVYGTAGRLPPDVLDTRWTHLSSRSDVGGEEGDGVVRIRFTPGKERHILLWFTKPPAAGPTVGISEVRLLD
jgi:hypothetical protein